MLLDEVDSYLPQAEELRGLLNAGHKRGACAYRCAGEGNSLRAFKAFAPAVLSGIGTLPGTLHDRSIHIPLVKAQPGEVTTPFNEDNIDLERTLARKIARWCLDNFDALRNLAAAKPISPANQSCSSALPACHAETGGKGGLLAPEPGGGDTLSASNGDHNSRREQPNLGNNIVADLGSHWEEGRGVDCSFGSTPVPIEIRKSKFENLRMPSTAHNRLADNYRPLFAIAQLAGGDWPKLVADAFAQLTARDFPDAQSIGISLLEDIRQIFTDSPSLDRISSHKLIATLCGLADKPWREAHNRKPINETWLGRRLSQYGINSKTIRIGEHRAKGYELADFQDAFARFLSNLQP
jgi:hypothetical protein